MDNVNTIRDDELKELSFQMMLIEGRKLQEENRKCFSKRLREEGKGGIYTAKEEKERYYMDLLRLDAEGYDLSLKYNDRLHRLGYVHNAYINGPDFTNIAAENLLNKYGLQYPTSWEIASQTNEGLVFNYFDFDKIDMQHQDFLSRVSKLREENKINDYEMRRLILAGEYYATHHKLLSAFKNKEEISSEEIMSGLKR